CIFSSLMSLVALIALIFFAFFSLSRALRDLHSFPTRRSSDLGCIQPCPHVLSERSRVPMLCMGLPGPETLLDFLPRDGPRRVVRSEEHTSELQSRFDLVCRLLLEKKKEQRN